ncbi:SUF system Fe-S cluster assembly protein [Aurantiacibacter zhengii]|uniref:SUF system Fe-S cluster assembly protein n=1 Tax=Aurantiacibacter zhengii TaxID=2307003 RepID=A0A418NTS1_9SPHN|nr:SUF system Fe-S cluster assembly protein [Aurantiacibacter zhengii]RIV86892.1 SUF system Fe-S cluster assembly protein [Aurantiacibacter zhengii]
MTQNEEKDFVAAPSPTENVAEKPPRARVSDAPILEEETAGEKLERKRDYLEGFLQKKPEGVAPGEPGGELHQSVIDALKDIYDPEIPVNIYDLGLIYNVEVAEDADVKVTMTLTTPHCPVAETMPNEIEMRVMGLPGVRDAEVVVTWDPPWDPSKMSDEARLELGML